MSEPTTEAEELHFVKSVRLDGRSETDLTELAMRTADVRGERIAELEAEIRLLRDELHEWRQWGRGWVAARREREGWVPVPGTMPPVAFGDKPRELNQRLDALLEARRDR